MIADFLAMYYNDGMNYHTGLVVGKFAPFHKGHEKVLSDALGVCDNLIVMSYTSLIVDKCSADERKSWLIKFTKHHKVEHRVKIVVIDPLATKIPNDNDSELSHRQFCADYLFNELNTSVQIVFGSESYIPGFAQFLSTYFTNKFNKEFSVKHLIIDIERTEFNVSGTQLRESNFETKLITEMLPSYVLPSFRKKVVFLGGESTGKTSIIKYLTDFLSTNAAYEFGRDYYDFCDHHLEYEQMQFIAESQIAREERELALGRVDTPLLCDSSALTTMFYSQEWFSSVSKELRFLAMESFSRYDKVFVCAPDFPMVQDGTRQDEVFRQKGHDFVVKMLQYTDTKYTLLSGPQGHRVETVVKELNS